MSDLPSAILYITDSQSQVGSVAAEALAQDIGQSCNWIIDNAKGSPLGSVKFCDLTEAQFQSFAGTGWVLCDGRALTLGNPLRTLTGLTAIPDMRGRFPRGKTGAEVLGDFRNSDNPVHTHVPTIAVNFVAKLSGVSDVNFSFQDPSNQYGPIQQKLGTMVVNNSGGNEFRPKDSITNAFIRIS